MSPPAAKGHTHTHTHTHHARARTRTRTPTHTHTHTHTHCLFMFVPLKRTRPSATLDGCQELKEASKALKRGLSFNSRLAWSVEQRIFCTAWVYLCLPSKCSPRWCHAGGMLTFISTWACSMLRKKSGTKPRREVVGRTKICNNQSM